MLLEIIGASLITASACGGSCVVAHEDNTEVHAISYADQGIEFDFSLLEAEGVIIITNRRTNAEDYQLLIHNEDEDLTELQTTLNFAGTIGGWQPLRIPVYFEAMGQEEKVYHIYVYARPGSTIGAPVGDYRLLLDFTIKTYGAQEPPPASLSENVMVDYSNIAYMPTDWENEVREGYWGSRSHVDRLHDEMRLNGTYDLSVVEYHYPDIEGLLTSDLRGTCLDLNAAFVAEMRMRQIPAKLVFGYVKLGQEDISLKYHAWAEVFTDGQWFRYDLSRAVACNTNYGGLRAWLRDDGNFEPEYYF